MHNDPQRFACLLHAKTSVGYLKRLLPSQLLCGGGAVLLNTIEHPGLRLEETVREGDSQ